MKDLQDAKVEAKKFEERAIEAEGILDSFKSRADRNQAKRSTATNQVTPPRDSNVPSSFATSGSANPSDNAMMQVAARPPPQYLAAPTEVQPKQAERVLTNYSAQELSAEELKVAAMDVVGDMFPPSTQKKKKSNQGTWSQEEMCTLFRERNRLGKNNWIEIAKHIPGKDNMQIFRKWKKSTKTTKTNALEASCVGMNVALDSGTGSVIYGSITAYEMDQETCVGTWTVIYNDGGKAPPMSKSEILAALDLYDEKKKSE